MNAHYDLAALLIDKGANPNLGDTSGMAALYAAVDMLHQAPMINRPLAKPSGKLRAMDVIARLLDHRADPEPGAQDAAADAAARVRRRRSSARAPRR